MRDKCRELLAAFATAVGFADFPDPDADGVCRVSDGRVTFGFDEFADSRELLVEARVGALPETGRAKFLSALVRANFQGQGAMGGALAVSDDDQIVLFRRFPLAGLTAKALAAGFEEVAAMAFEWRRLAEAYRPVAEREAQKAAEAPDFAPQSFAGGFLRV